jgi:hypothetical protein
VNIILSVSDVESAFVPPPMQRSLSNLSSPLRVESEVDMQKELKKSVKPQPQKPNSPTEQMTYY